MRYGKHNERTSGNFHGFEKCNVLLGCMCVFTKALRWTLPVWMCISVYAMRMCGDREREIEMAKRRSKGEEQELRR
jgi:hypothetical protein